VFAAYAAYTDHEIGRVIQELQDLGKLDNTLIIYIEGDNGTSAEGSTMGTPNVMTSYQAIPVPVQEQLKFYDAWGSSKTYPHMAELPVHDRRAVRSMARGNGLRILLWIYGRRDRSVDALPIPQHHPDFSLDRKTAYNLTTDMADEAIKYLRDLNTAAPDKPFFLYYVPGGTHAPHQPTQEWIDKFKGKFDMGWNAMREQIFANQKLSSRHARMRTIAIPAPIHNLRRAM
jgi:arylsulfatase A-like enzyme